MLAFLAAVAFSGCGQITGSGGGAGSTVSASVSAIDLTVPHGVLRVGQTQQLQAAARDASGKELAGTAFTWSSSDTTVARMSTGSPGSVTAVAPGTATVSASAGGKVGTATLSVTLVPVGSVSVKGTVTSLYVGESTQLAAVVLDTAGNALTGRSIAWQSSNPGVVTVSANGASTATVAAVAAGSGNIIATTGGVTGQMTVTATSPPPPPPPQATSLAITAQPSSTAQSGVALAQQPVLQLRDASNNPVSQAGVSVAAAVVSGGGTLSGTTLVSTDANGAATFTNLAITGSGAQTLQFSASGLSGATSSTITVSSNGGGGASTLLFQELFDDTNFGARGWYDLPSGGITSVTTAQHIPGSTASLQMNFPQGSATTPTPSTAARHLFTPTNSVYLRYWVKHSTNWVGSGLTYHPHEFYFLTTEDAQYAGPASNYLTTYVEENFQSVGGYAVMSAQDSKNIDATHINQDLTGVTERRAVSGCNGEPDNTPTTCYQSGGAWYNGKTWKSTQPVFQQTAGPGYKGDWHKVEAYFQLNSIVNGIGQRDGVAQYWVDGVLVIDRHDLMFRTGVHTSMQFNQLVMGPYMGSGSPVSQTLWFDDLVVMTTRPASP